MISECAISTDQRWKASGVNINIWPAGCVCSDIYNILPSAHLSAAGALPTSAAPGPGPGLAAATVNTGIREILVTEREGAETTIRITSSSREREGGIEKPWTRFKLAVWLRKSSEIF